MPKKSWTEVTEQLLGKPLPEDTFELRKSFIESCLLDQDGNRITQGELHDVMQRFVYECQDKRWGGVMMMAPYNSGKSQQFPVALATYFSTRKPELEHLIISADPSLANKRITAIRSMVESAEYRLWCKTHGIEPLVYDTSRDTSSMEKIYFLSKNRTGNPSFEAKGVLAGGAGQRCTYLWLDDICSDADRTSRAHREKVYSRTTQTWIKRLHEKGIVIGVMTPYHEDDANMRLCSEGTYNVLKIAVNAEKSGYDVEEYISDYVKELIDDERSDIHES